MKDRFISQMGTAFLSSRTAIGKALRNVNDVMKISARKMENRAFDVAAGPLLLTLIGIPVLMIIAVVVLILITVKLIKRARKKNTDLNNAPENKDSHGNGQ